MKILSMEVNRTLLDMSEERLVGVVREAADILASFKQLEDLLLQAKDMAEGPQLDEVLDYQLDVIDMINMSVDYENIRLFAEGFCAVQYSIDRRAKHAVHYLDIAKTLIAEAAGPFIPLSTKKAEEMRKVVYHVLAEVSYFLYYQFRMDLTKKSIDEDGELQLNVALKSYLDDSGKSLDDLIQLFRQVMDTHRPNITIFEAFPELEEEFYSIAGAYIRDFETFSEYVTKDLVVDVITGKVDAETVVRDLENRASELGDEDA